MFIDLVEEHRHFVGQELLIPFVQFEHPDVVGQACDRSTYIDSAADHADAAAITEYRFKLLAVDAADHGDAAAHEFKGEGTGVLQNPHLRRTMGRVVFHQ